MRIRTVLTAVFAVLVLSPAAASASIPGGGDDPDFLHWSGHSSCGTVAFEAPYVHSDYPGDLRLWVSGTIANCPTVKQGDFFVVAGYGAGTAGAIAKVLYYYQGPETYFDGNIRLNGPATICLASYYDERMACLAVTVSGSTWSVAPVSTEDPSVDIPITSNGLVPGDPKCATCWDN